MTTSSITLRTNIASLQTQRRLGNSTEALRESFTRLSSGLRINKASDDAAGLAIASGLDIDRRVFARGIRNVNDGISYLNITETALNALANLVLRQTELAEQAANGIYGKKQREALNSEANALVSEFNRTAASTQFNGKYIFSGEQDKISIQGGYSTLDIEGLSTPLINYYADGSFQASVSLGTSIASAGRVVTGDINNDGFLDIISGANTDIEIHLGNGDGTFRSPSSYVAEIDNGATRISIVDLNKDGYDDIVTTRNGGLPRTQLAYGQPNGTIGGFGNFPFNAFPSEFGDFDSDGNLDFLGSGEVRFGNGDTTFDAPISLNAGYTIGTVGDLNNDGVDDLILQPLLGFEVLAYVSNNDRTFTPTTGVLSMDQKTYNSGGFSNLGAANESRIGDINGDGNADYVTFNLIDGTLNYRYGNGDGTFGALQKLSVPGINGVELGDVNQDGLTDILTGGSSIGVHIGLGSGAFAPKVDYALPAGTSAIALADLNGDGVKDILHGGSSPGILFANATPAVKMDPIDLTTQSSSRDTLDILSELQQGITLSLQKVGAYASRLQVMSQNLSTLNVNYTDAKSRITDVDIAEESANLVKNNILQGAVVAILSQANQQPELARKLLEF